MMLFSNPSYDIYRGEIDKGDICEFKIATPRTTQRNFFGNAETEALFNGAESLAQKTFSSVREIDFAPFLALNELMFFGPFVAERDVSVGDFLRDNPSAGHGIVRNIILDSSKWSAADAYRALYKLKVLKHGISKIWDHYDALMVPTVGTVYTIKDIQIDPLKPNFNNGYYTNFANPLGLVAISVPECNDKVWCSIWGYIPGTFGERYINY